MEEFSGISKSRLSEAVNHDKAPLNTNELGRICEALGVSASEMLRRSESKLAVELAEDFKENGRTLSVAPELTPQEMADAALAKKQDGYGLAARMMRDLKPGEEPGVEYYE